MLPLLVVAGTWGEVSSGGGDPEDGVVAEEEASRGGEFMMIYRLDNVQKGDGITGISRHHMMISRS